MSLSSITSLLVGIFSFFFLMESPRYMVAKGEVVEGLNILEKMIEMNKQLPAWVNSFFNNPLALKDENPFSGSL